MPAKILMQAPANWSLHVVDVGMPSGGRYVVPSNRQILSDWRDVSTLLGLGFFITGSQAPPLDALGNTMITNPSNNDVLTWSASDKAWENKAGGAGTAITNGVITAEATTVFPMLYEYGGTITGQTGIWVTPPSGTDTSAAVLISPNSGNSNGIGYLSIMSNAAQPATINMATGSGSIPTVGSPSTLGPLPDGGTISGLYTWGFLADKSPFNVASVEVLSHGTWTGIYSPTSMRFSTTGITNPGTTVRQIHLDIDQNGNVNVENGVLITKDVHTKANLPTASAALTGARSVITNAGTPVFNGSIVGGGTVSAPVWCDGTLWRYG